ncbi:MAG: AEC family transporter [Rhodobacter sp.]|nr:AEC family transporter [Paracoccaceae bacterium]MCC0078131.1 AEC family transporter [Rhodobacter sp.]
MLDVFLTTLPIYLMIVIGFAAVRWGYFDAAHVQGLSQFALKIALIALIFSAIAMPRGEGGLNAAFMAAYLGGSLATMLIGFAAVRLFLRQSAADSWILAMGMSNSNSGFMGFPIGSLFFGHDAAVVFAMTMTIENAVTLPLPTVAAGIAGHTGQRGTLLRSAVLRIVKNPLIIAVAVSLAVRLSGVAVPEALGRTATTIASAASPVALFVIGGTVARLSLSGHWRRTTAITLGKLVLHPLLVTAALFLVPGVPAALIPVGILFAAVPMLTIYPILAASFGLGAVTSTALVVATGLSFVSVSLVLSLLTGL